VLHQILVFYVKLLKINAHIFSKKQYNYCSGCGNYIQKVKRRKKPPHLLFGLKPVQKKFVQFLF